MAKYQKPTLGHRMQYIGFRLLEQGLSLASLKTVFRLGQLLGRISYRIMPAKREIVIRNLRFAYAGEKSPEEIEEIASDVFENSGANLLTSLRIPFLSDFAIFNTIRFKNKELLYEANSAGGVILVVPHMGNWELLAQSTILAQTDSEIGTHYRPLSNPLINQVIEQRRTHRGLHLFAKLSSTHKIASFIRDGGILGILADQRVGRHGTPGIFFDRATTCSPLPSLLARRTKATLIGMHCVTVGECEWEIRFNRINEATPQACADSLETAWRSSPTDVFWFQERWKLRGKRGLDFLWKYPETPAITKPYRFVSLLEDGPPDLPENLVTVETLLIDWGTADIAIKQSLAQLSKEGPLPVDAFITSPAHKSRLKKLAGEIPVFTPKEMIAPEANRA